MYQCIILFPVEVCFCHLGELAPWNWQSSRTYVSFQHVSTPNYAAFRYKKYLKKQLLSQALGPELGPVANTEEDGTYTGQLPCVNVFICATIPSFWYHCNKTKVAIHNGLVIDRNRVSLYFLRKISLSFPPWLERDSVWGLQENVGFFLLAWLNLTLSTMIVFALIVICHFHVKVNLKKEIQTPVGLTCWNDWEAELKLKN